jgi:carbohydrate kinase (thermoresistant glucokinase family)
MDTTLKPRVLVLIGPMGCGKTTIGKLLSRKLGWPFYDGDDFHPPQNVEKMRQGIPLDDNDRMPWLKALRSEIKTWLNTGQRALLACSALKQQYRDILGIDQKQVISVYLKGSFDLLQERIGTRQHPYMNKQLLQSQIEALQAPEGGLTVDISHSPEKIARTIVHSIP